MNAQTAEIFRQARAMDKNTASVLPPDYHALAIRYTDEMQRLGAPGKVLNILANYDFNLLTPAERWSLLPKASQIILANYQAAGGGSYVPLATGESNHE